MRGRAPLTSEDQEEEEPHPDPEEDLHDDLPQGRAQRHGRRGLAQQQASRPRRSHTDRLTPTHFPLCRYRARLM